MNLAIDILVALYDSERSGTCSYDRFSCIRAAYTSNRRGTEDAMSTFESTSN